MQDRWVSATEGPPYPEGIAQNGRRQKGVKFQ